MVGNECCQHVTTCYLLPVLVMTELNWLPSPQLGWSHSDTLTMGEYLDVTTQPCYMLHLHHHHHYLATLDHVHGSLEELWILEKGDRVCRAVLTFLTEYDGVSARHTSCSYPGRQCQWDCTNIKSWTSFIRSHNFLCWFFSTLSYLNIW